GSTYVRSRCRLISGFRRRQPRCRIAHRRFCRRLHDLGYRFGVTGSVNQICTSSVSLLAASSNGSTNPRFAYLHAAAMVKAGIYLVARFAPAFSGETIWQVMVLGVGMWTMLVGGWRALRQTDVKLILAYGTVSQLGLLMIANGLGT